MNRVHERMGLEISLGDIFNSPTIRELAEFLDGLERGTMAAIERAEPVFHGEWDERGERAECYGLSFAQKRLYILQQLEPSSTAYNMPFSALLEGDADRQKLEKTFGQLVERHESFRTSFVMVDETPCQRIHGEVGFKIEYWEHSGGWGSEGAGTEETVLSGLLRDFVKPFDLAAPPLLRVGLVKLATEGYLLLVDMHHVISDGLSMGILVREFMALYNGEIVPPPQLTYKDFAHWQQQSYGAGVMREQEAFWLKVFSSRFSRWNYPRISPGRRCRIFRAAGMILPFPGT